MASPSHLPKLRPALDYGMRKVQRHITTLDSEGRSVFVPDEDILYCDRGGYAVSWTYATSEFPAVLSGNKDLDGFLTRDPSSNNSVAHTGSRIVNGTGITFNTTNFAPGTETVMHRTVSLDFVAVVEGEMELELDSGAKVSLKPGDSIVQRQTNHLWRNPSKDKPARIISLITPAQSVTINGKEMTTEGFSVGSMGKRSMVTQGIET
ncbi:cupin domain-containing protein [Phialemonium atrogriseum]|uniref:Cupin domain-containing protein n=1 Tax=Phialemonium atrogriseum TaxID=1093897 RepID=A0AAJ0FAQ5_9PEZI|nr:cupin domain-containing protein [Phialemonium atrogriseum]KAK1761636.1 cupin domain-containing protein [Phialemonium atrogriseum]